MSNETKNNKTFNAKEIQKKAANRNMKVHLNDRMKVRITKATGYYYEGQVVNPHKIYAMDLIKNGTAEEVKK